MKLVMYIYSVRINIKKEVEAEWLSWMKENHLKDVMDTGYFNSCEISKQVIPEVVPGESIYLISYSIDSIEKYNKYLAEEAPRLRNEHIEKFPGKFEASRAVFRKL